jgi:hypothetical protein
MPNSLTEVIKITRVRSPPPLTRWNGYLSLKAVDSVTLSIVKVVLIKHLVFPEPASHCNCGSVSAVL